MNSVDISPKIQFSMENDYRLKFIDLKLRFNKMCILSLHVFFLLHVTLKDVSHRLRRISDTDEKFDKRSLIPAVSYS